MNDFLAALISEISGLETLLEQDVRYVRLREARKLLSLYTESESDAVRGRPTGRTRSPEREQIISIAKEFIAERPTPTPTRDVLEYLLSRGVKIPGASPQNNLSAMLSNSSDFKTHGRAGWTLAPTEAEEESLRTKIESILRAVANANAESVKPIVAIWDKSKLISPEVEKVIWERVKNGIGQEIPEDEKPNAREKFISFARQVAPASPSPPPAGSPPAVPSRPAPPRPPTAERN